MMQPGGCTTGNGCLPRVKIQQGDGGENAKLIN